MFTCTPTVESVASTTTYADAAIPNTPIGSSNAATKCSTRCAAAVAVIVVLFGLLLPARATTPQDRMSGPSELSVGSAATTFPTPDRNSAIAMTSHLP